MSGIALKLTSLLVRTVAKPVAGVIKAQAKERVWFRKACILLAQGLHKTDVRLRMQLLGDKEVKVRPLNDVRAIENGAQFVLEAFIFLVAGGLILYEAVRSSKKESTRREGVKDDIAGLQEEVARLRAVVEEYGLQLKLLEDARAVVAAAAATTPPATP